MNVVTIDLDIIMEPNINLYNDWVGTESYIDDFIKDHSLLENIKANFYIYEYLTRYIIKTIKKLSANKVFFITNHDTIINYIEKGIVNLYNIDHHHDIFYGEDEEINLPLLTPSCGNWVKYLFDNKKIKQYTWIKNSNSIEPTNNITKVYKHTTNLLKLVNLNELAENTDMLFICASPEWVPTNFMPLFDSWIAICEEYYGEPFKVI